ncbi:MAG: nuclear transport factor 2 family protein [Planctomycetaceae bacterium]
MTIPDEPLVPAADKLVAGDDSPRHREVEAQIRHYFATWSDGDIDGYGRCFHPQGVIQLQDQKGDIQTFLRGPFVEWQRQQGRRATEKLVETPETIEIVFEEDVARVSVLWKLRAGPRTDWGYDHFTLVRQAGRWQIVHLLFYSIPEPPRKR